MMNQADRVNTFIIVFDGHCPMCHGCIRFLLRYDRHKHFCFTPLQSSVGQGLVSESQQSGQCVEGGESVLYYREGNIFLRYLALQYILRDLGGVWKVLGRVLGWVPLSIGDFMYTVVAGFRYKLFGRYDHCPLPSKDVRDRFL